MKKIISLILILYSGLALHAQTYKTDNNFVSKKSRYEAGISLGMGIPFSNFGKFDQAIGSGDTTKLQGAAKTGFHFAADFGFMFSPYIGAGMVIGGNIHTLDDEKIKATFPTIPTPFGNLSPTITSTSHYLGQYLAGPLFVLPINDRFNLKARIIGGLMTVSYSPITASIGTFGSVIITPKSTSAFTYGGGIGASFLLNPLISVDFKTDFLTAAPTFESYSLVGSINQTVNRKTTMSTGLLNIGLGIGFHF